MRNIEKLRNYFLGKDPQLNETLADNSLKLIGIPGKFFVVRSEMLKALKTLKDDLQAKIDAEADTRAEADAVLSGLIDQIQDWIDHADFISEEDLNAALSSYYTKEQVDALISVIPTFEVRVVIELPSPLEGEFGVLYLVPSDDPEQQNVYNEFILVEMEIDGAPVKFWEQVGSTAIDMSNYYTKAEVDSLIAAHDYTELDDDIMLSNMSGTITAHSGLYFSGDYHVKSSYQAVGHQVEYILVPQNTFFYIPPLKNYISVGYGEWSFSSTGYSGQPNWVRTLYFTYNNLTNKPQINNVELKGNKSLSDLGIVDFVGTDGTENGDAGLVPEPTLNDAGKFLCADGTWQTITIPQSGPITVLDQDYTLTTPSAPFLTGVYYSGTHTVDTDLIQNPWGNEVIIPEDMLFFFDASYDTFELLYTKGVNSGELTLKEWWEPDRVHTTWIHHMNAIEEEITSVSRPDKVAGADAVYNFMQKEKGINNILEPLTSYVTGSYFDLTSSFVGDAVASTLTTTSNTCYLAIQASAILDGRVCITGFCSSAPYFVCDGDPTDPNTLLTFKDTENHGYTDEIIDLPQLNIGDYVVFNFTSTNTDVPSVSQVYQITEATDDITVYRSDILATTKFVKDYTDDAINTSITQAIGGSY